MFRKRSNSHLRVTPLADVDFITGKRRSLSSTLYNVAKERGIDQDGILYLIQTLPDLESFLYSTSVKRYHRDHTEHQLRVAVLGDFLLEQDIGTGSLLGLMSELTGIKRSLLKEKIWWVTGLIHDVGYPLEKMTTAVNWSLVNQLLKSYPYLPLESVPLEVMISPEGKDIPVYLDILEETLSKEARKLIRKGASANESTIPIPEPKTFLGGANGHQEYTFESPVQLDHGVVGALSLLQSLGTPEEIRENKEEYKGYIKAARVIALHNFKKELKDFTFDTHPLGFFLALVAEMQEWGRSIPLQVRDSYFTVDLKKVALLDEIRLLLDEREWMMQFRNMNAKKLSKFDFRRFTTAKEVAFNRLQRGDHFPQNDVVLQDLEPSPMTSAKADPRKPREKVIDEARIVV